MSTKGIENQFMVLYDEQADAVFRFCLLRTSDRSTALDITQETFLKFWKVLLRGDRVDNERALLFTITRNLVIDWFRSKRPLSLDALSEWDEESAEEGFPSIVPEEVGRVKDDLELQSEAQFVMRRLHELDPPYREALYLRFVEDMRPAEIAGIVGKSVNVVSVRIHRGIQKLRKLTGYEYVREQPQPHESI
jgi:RNA polymerase sigma-70 factor (ECF subfamily)